MLSLNTIAEPVVAAPAPAPSSAGGGGAAAAAAAEAGEEPEGKGKSAFIVIVICPACWMFQHKRSNFRFLRLFVILSLLQWLI